MTPLRYPPDTLPRCPVHGQMRLRPLAGQTREQRWCGTWYDCQGSRCSSAALILSSELAAQYAAHRRA